MNAVVGAPHPYIAALLAGCEPAVMAEAARLIPEAITSAKKAPAL